MIRNPCIHCGRHAKRLVNSAKIVVHEIQGKHMPANLLRLTGFLVYP
jgi:hypothetical protein